MGAVTVPAWKSVFGKFHKGRASTIFIKGQSRFYPRIRPLQNYYIVSKNTVNATNVEDFPEVFVHDVCYGITVFEKLDLLVIDQFNPSHAAPCHVLLSGANCSVV